MIPKDEMLDLMTQRAEGVVPEGQPIIPEGHVATTEDIQEFKRLIKVLGYEVKFGQPTAVTKPSEAIVHLTPSCTVGVLSDEYLHIWNNFAETRGGHLEDNSLGAEHRVLGRTFRFSGSSNDRRFHQLELQNYLKFLRSSGNPIPIFLWRTFNSLGKRKEAGSD